MANKVYNMEGGLHSAAAYSAFENSMWGSCVASSSDFVATAGTGMNISLSAGNGMIDTGLGFSRRIASDAVNTISVDAASSANPRKDALVAYIDNGVTPTTSVLDNTNDILKFACVAGNPAATPAAPSDAAIQTAIGAGNPYVVLWYVTVPKSATSLSTATFTDNRNISSKIDGSNIKDGTVTSSKIDYATMAAPYFFQNSFDADQSGQEITLNTANYTSKTGRIMVVAHAIMKTSTFTSNLRIEIDGTAKSVITTNQTSYIGMDAVWVGEVGTQQVQIKSIAKSQNANTTVSVAGYTAYYIAIFDI